MARLTWRDVAAPDFSDAILARKAAGESFARATEMISGGASGYGEEWNRMLSNQAISQASQIRDTNTWDQVMAKQGLGGFGVGADQLNETALSFLTNQRGVLEASALNDDELVQNAAQRNLWNSEMERRNILNQQDQQNMGQQAWRFGNEQRDDARSEENRALLEQAPTYIRDVIDKGFVRQDLARQHILDDESLTEKQRNTYLTQFDQIAAPHFATNSATPDMAFDPRFKPIADQLSSENAAIEDQISRSRDLQLAKRYQEMNDGFADASIALATDLSKSVDGIGEADLSQGAKNLSKIIEDYKKQYPHASQQFIATVIRNNIKGSDNILKFFDKGELAIDRKGVERDMSLFEAEMVDGEPVMPGFEAARNQLTQLQNQQVVNQQFGAQLQRVMADAAVAATHGRGGQRVAERLSRLQQAIETGDPALIRQAAAETQAATLEVQAQGGNGANQAQQPGSSAPAGQPAANTAARQFEIAAGNASGNLSAGRGSAALVSEGGGATLTFPRQREVGLQPEAGPTTQEQVGPTDAANRFADSRVSDVPKDRYAEEIEQSRQSVTERLNQNRTFLRDTTNDLAGEALGWIRGADGQATQGIGKLAGMLGFEEFGAHKMRQGNDAMAQAEDFRDNGVNFLTTPEFREELSAGVSEIAQERLNAQPPRETVDRVVTSLSEATGTPRAKVNEVVGLMRAIQTGKDPEGKPLSQQVLSRLRQMVAEQLGELQMKLPDEVINDPNHPITKLVNNPEEWTKL